MALCYEGVEDFLMSVYRLVARMVNFSCGCGCCWGEFRLGKGEDDTEVVSRVFMFISVP